MLINLSNHPITEWSDEQLKLAEELFNEVKDWTFPSVVPYSSETEILELAKSALVSIKEFKPWAVHVMGEHTFTYSFVRLAQLDGIRCIASTTKRNFKKIDNDGYVRSFEFVMFRDYPKI
jgi:hypothetical protein